MWYAMDNDGRIYVIRELYGSAAPNEGVVGSGKRVAQEIKRIESEVFKDRGAIRGETAHLWDAQGGGERASQQ